MGADTLTKARLLLIRIGKRGAFVRQVSVTFLAQGATLLLSLGTTAILARWLGPEGKGIVSLALLVPGMLALFLNGGVGISNVYFAGSRRYDVPTLTANSSAFALLATGLGAILVGGLAATGWSDRLLPGVALGLLLIAMLEFPIRLLMGYLNAILQGLQQITLVNLITLSDAGLTLILTIAFVIGLGMSRLGAILASLGAVTIAVAILYLLIRKMGGRIRPRWDLPVMRTTLSFGLRGYIGNVLQFFNYRLDMFLVNYFLGPAGVGIYGASVRLAEMLWYLPNAVSFVIFPKAAATRPEAMNRFTPRVFAFTLGLTILGGVALAALGRFLILLIYSSAFLDAYIPLLALLPGVILLGGAKVLTNEIAGRGFPHYNSINAGLSLILTVILDLVLIPRYQILGASLASSVAYTTTFVTAIGFFFWVSRRASRTSP